MINGHRFADNVELSMEQTQAKFLQELSKLGVIKSVRPLDLELD